MIIIEEAISFAVKAHYGKSRKGKTRPYILHPVEAMNIVASMTEDEEVIAAAVLHDTVEDTNITIDEIKARFGEKVAKLVASESENKREGQPPKDTWRIRKEEAIDHLKIASREAKMVCELSRDYAKIGDSIWVRFNQKDPEQHAWYYGSLFEIISKEFPNTPATKEYHDLFQKVFGKP